jgi:hypothetical protein
MRLNEYVSMAALPWLDMYSKLSTLRQLAKDYQNHYTRVRIGLDVLFFLQNAAPC